MDKIIKIIYVFVIISFLLIPKHQARALDFDDITNTITTFFESLEDIQGTVLEPLVKVTAERLLDKVTDDVLSWANNGFDGEPGFINNWDGFLENTAYESINQGFEQAQRARSEAQANALNTTGVSCSGLVDPGPCNDQYINEYLACIDGLDPVDDAELYELCEETQDVEEIAYDQCLDEVDAYQQQLAACQETGSPATNPEEVAEQNYNLSQSDTYQNSRSIERTIINYGVQQFGDNELTRAIEQQGENLTELLGSEEAKRQFESDFSAGGWEGFLALTNPSNTKAGTESLVKAAIQSQTSEDVNDIITDLQTPQRFLDKTRCVERDAENNCVREETLTPGAQVAEKVNEALFKDEGLAENADGIGIIPLLQSAVGKVTSGLINQGLAELGGATSSAVFGAVDNVFTGNDVQTGNLQSQFDVLGVADDGFIDSSSPTELVNFGNETGSLDTIPIGGPEDRAGFGQGGAQIIIDFEQNLERASRLAEEEQSYFNELDLIRSNNKDTVINLDRCLPGPDYNWEERYNDYLPSGNDENGQKNALGLSETRKMFNDERVNMPGSQTIKSTISSIIGNTREQEAFNKQRKDTLSNLRSSLSYIRGEILADFNVQKASVNENLVIFYEDWNNLTQDQQLQLAQLALNTGELINVDEEDLPILLEEDNERVAASVISIGWDLWRTETSREQKNDLRYAYYVEQNNLSNDEFIGRIRSQVNQTLTRITQAQQLLRDCLVLRAYTHGESVVDLLAITSEGDSESLDGLNTQITSLLNLSYFRFFSDRSPLSGGPDFINNDNARDNDEIRSFLEAQYQSNQSNLFLTTTIAGDSTTLNNSILGFNSQEEQEDYFESIYPTDDFPTTDFNILDNYYELAEIFSVDRFYWGGNRSNGINGVLFCRNTRGNYLIHTLGVTGPRCMIGRWYIASDLDYEVAFAGI